MDGIDTCMVALLPMKYLDKRRVLEGRIAQVTEFFRKSRSETKKNYSLSKDGVAMAVLIDHAHDGDEDINGLLSDVESSDESSVEDIVLEDLSASEDDAPVEAF